MWPVWILFGVLVYFFYINDLIHESVGLIVLAVTAVIMGLIFFSSLRTEVSNEGVFYRMHPFQRKPRHHSWQEIESWEVRKYRPIGEYGGYGIRFGSKGKAYNVKGQMGLQLILKNGKRILIGTQRPDMLRETLKRIHRNER